MQEQGIRRCAECPELGQNRTWEIRIKEVQQLPAMELVQLRCCFAPPGGGGGAVTLARGAPATSGGFASLG